MAGKIKKIKRIGLKPSGLALQISAKLTQAILGGAFNGGTQLIETDLQKQFAVSRSPIREALRDLEKKGLVEIIPRRGTFLKKITHKDIEDSLPVRSLLEGLAAREARRNLSKEDYDGLEKALQGMKEAADKENAKLYMKHHDKFHKIYIHASKNNVLINILENLLIQNAWFLFSLFFSRHFEHYKEDLKTSIELHREIFELFRNKEKDEKEIEDKVKRHIELASKRVASLKERKRLNDAKSKSPGIKVLFP